MSQRLPTYFISHGGGPWPYIDDMRPMMRTLEQALQDIPRTIGVVPKAVLVVSGHWEEPTFSVMSAPKPSMVYDYSGFPPHTYEVVYGAPGAPQLANRVVALMEAAGIAAQLDGQRGFDHGTFAPLVVMYPQANVPVFQLSMKRGLDPAEHIAAGRALAPLRDEGVLIVGSGLSFHNLRLLSPQGRAPSLAFDNWLSETLVNCAPEDREQRLIHWEQAPAARICHPREDHLIPLMVALGAAAQDRALRCYHENSFFGSITVSSYRFDS
jgi:aromatic ring-opening dioxygenase catalytic subunit (LigB family)